MAPLPDLVLYARPGCSLCDEAREAIELVLADRHERGLDVPNVVERNIEDDAELHRALFDRIPVVELGELRVELFVSVGKVRRMLNEAFGDAPVEVAAEQAAEPAREGATEPAREGATEPAREGAAEPARERAAQSASAREG